MTWQEGIVDVLLRQRAMGVADFNRAWRVAVAVHPRPHDYCRPTGYDDPEALPFSTWFREQCRAEWDGRPRADFAGLRELLEDSAMVARRRVDARDARTRLLA